MKRFYVSIIVLLFFISCEKENEVKEFEKQISIVSADLPNTMRLGDQANLKLYIEFENPCAEFSRFERADFLTYTDLKAYGMYKEGNCLTLITRDSVYLSFEAKRLGYYYFDFHLSNDSIVRDSIFVN